MKHLILIALIFFNIVNADSGLYDIDYDDISQEKHLYLTNPNKIEDMDTVTYLIGIKNEDIVKIFKKFSIDLGKTNGGVDLLHNSDKYWRYIKKSKCSFSDAKNFILFEDRISNSCITMIITDENQTLNMLQEISRLIDDKDKKLGTTKFRSQVLNFIRTSDIDENLKASLVDFVNWVI